MEGYNTTEILMHITYLHKTIQKRLLINFNNIFEICFIVFKIIFHALKKNSFKDKNKKYLSFFWVIIRGEISAMK